MLLRKSWVSVGVGIKGCLSSSPLGMNNTSPLPLHNWFIISNGVQLVITIIASIKHQSKIVQTWLVGSVISNMVLMVGIGFFFGGLQRPEQNFDRTSTNNSLDTLVLCVATLIIPTALNFLSGLDKSSAQVAKVSRAEAVFLLLSYFFYLCFAYKTHAYMYTTPHLRVPMRNFYQIWRVIRWKTLLW